MPPALTSKDHPLAKRIRLVASRARRAPAELVLAEGTRVLEEASRAGLAIEAVVVDDRFGASGRQAALMATWRERGVPVRVAAGKLLTSLSEVAAPQGGIALVRAPIVELAELKLPRAPLLLCACGIKDPGNLGTLVRSAAAASAAAVLATHTTVSARSAKAVRASAGSFFRIPVVEDLEPAELVEFFRASKLQPLRADPRLGSPYWETDLRAGTVLLLGGEAHGFQDAAWEAIPPVRIPMAAASESLNVSTAGSVLLFEAVRQRAAESVLETRERTG
jgi:TrmH family RNA methyltransferase